MNKVYYKNESKLVWYLLLAFSLGALLLASIKILMVKINTDIAKYLAFFCVTFLLISCSKQSESTLEANRSVATDTSIIISITQPQEFKKKFIEYPIPDIDSLLLYYETSGIAGNYPSDKHFNQSDSGILVFYTLFEKILIDGKYRIINDNYNNTLITHTYWKDKYGWAAEDKDQTFIQLLSESSFFGIGQNIQIGNTKETIEFELGSPLYQIRLSG